MTEKEICELLEKKQYKTVKEAFAEMNEVDLAELLEELPEKQMVMAFRLVGKEKGAETFSNMEAEQQQIGQCSYFSFRVMSTLFPIVMLVLFLLANNGMAQSGWVLLVGGLWMVQLMSYQCMAYILDHGKKKHKV